MAPRVKITVFKDSLQKEKRGRKKKKKREADKREKKMDGRETS